MLCDFKEIKISSFSFQSSRSKNFFIIMRHVMEINNKHGLPVGHFKHYQSS